MEIKTEVDIEHECPTLERPSVGKLVFPYVCMLCLHNPCTDAVVLHGSCVQSTYSGSF